MHGDTGGQGERGVLLLPSRFSFLLILPPPFFSSPSPQPPPPPPLPPHCDVSLLTLQVEGTQPIPTSSNKPAAVEQPSPQRKASVSSSSRAVAVKSTNDSPAKRSSSSSSGTPRRLERSDTSFASVDISDITELDEEKNRSPTPQPTFDDRPFTAQVGRRDPLPDSSEVSRSGARVSPVKRRQVAWTDSREVPEESVSRTSPEESAPASPVIKKLQPAYSEVPHIVATNNRYSSYRYLLRSKSVPDISTTADTSDNLRSDDSRTAPGSCRERARKRRSVTAGQSLSLAQRVYLARRVESYIASVQSQVK